MPRRRPRIYTPIFKSKIELRAIKCKKRVAQFALRFDDHANQINKWKTQLWEWAGVVFESSGHPEAPPINIKALQAAWIAGRHEPGTIFTAMD